VFTVRFVSVLGGDGGAQNVRSMTSLVIRVHGSCGGVAAGVGIWRPWIDKHHQETLESAVK
jgi:hypothetical protein